MLREKRFELILENLKLKEAVTFEELAGSLGVSDDTIRRDIEYLHKNGLLSKVRGGAIPREKNPLTFKDRQTHFKKEKEIIALKTLRLLEDGMTVFMDGGTTNCAVAEYIPADIKLRVVTNNYSLIAAFDQHMGVELIVAGGNFDRSLSTFYGLITCTTIAEYIADVYLMATCAVDQHFGVSTNFQKDAEVKRAMHKAARKTVVLGNHERLRRVDNFKVCEIQETDVLITDLDSNDEELDGFRNLGIQLI